MRCLCAEQENLLLLQSTSTVPWYVHFCSTAAHMKYNYLFVLSAHNHNLLYFSISEGALLFMVPAVRISLHRVR